MSPPSPKPMAPGPRIEDIIEGGTQVAIEDPVEIYIGHENTLILRRTLLYIEAHAAFILRVIFIKFLLIFIIMLPFGEFSFTDIALMPCIGIVAASLANSVPVGGGVVFIPALHLLGLHMKLGVSFSFATMSVGNGVFGFLNWVARDKGLIIWESAPFALVPSWVRASILMLFARANSSDFHRLDSSSESCCLISVNLQPESSLVLSVCRSLYLFCIFSSVED
jgi:hypothetical protein